MKISSLETSFIDYPNQTSMVVFMTGCSIGCPNCHNPALQDPNTGINVTMEEIKHQLIKRPLCRHIVFSGGDPLFQSEELIPYCKELSRLAKIGIYTGKSLSDVPSELLQYISFLKTEPYIEKSGPLSSETTNQKCWDIIDGKPILNTQYFKIK